MVSNALRVVLASDQVDIRRQLGDFVRRKLNGVVVGESENAIRAVRLARQLRPDMAIIDTYLPHNVGVTGVPLSKNAGLDAAQLISAEIPDVRVVLVNHEADQVYPGAFGTFLSPESKGTNVANITWNAQPGLNFASLHVTPLPEEKHDFSNKCFLVGICGVFVGLVLTVTILLAYIGLPMMLLGSLSLLVGFVAKIIKTSS